jgi:predicted class III extradiol MEMO1 family dioxygenase
MNRKAAVAGQFYSGSKESLNKDLKILLFTLALSIFL